MSQASAASQASGGTQNYGYSSSGTEIDDDGSESDSQSSVSDDRSTQPIGEPQNPPASTYDTLYDHYYYCHLPPHLHGYPEVVEAAEDGGQAVVKVGDEASVTEEEASVTEEEEEPAQA